MQNNTIVKHRFGLIVPASNLTMEEEFRKVVPSGYAYNIARIITQAVTVEGLKPFREGIKKAGEEIREARVDLIVVGCTSGTFIDGMMANKQIEEELEKITGVPAITTSTAVVETLKELKVKTVALGTPYSNEITEIEVGFLKEQGFNIIRYGGLGIETKRSICFVPRETVINLAKSVYDETADAIFLSCTNLPTLEVINELTEMLGRPVISSNFATLYFTLKRLGRMFSFNDMRKLYSL